jgi:hypothetical protein
VIRVERLPKRRGPPAEARETYVEIEERPVAGAAGDETGSDLLLRPFAKAEPLTREGGGD